MNTFSLEWLLHFARQIEKSRSRAWRLLLLDGYGSHCTRDFVEYCDIHKIIPFNLLPHSAYFLQPLNVVLSQPYKHWHSEAVDEATRAGCKDFNKVEFLAAFSSIWD